MVIEVPVWLLWVAAGLGGLLLLVLAGLGVLFIYVMWNWSFIR